MGGKVWGSGRGGRGPGRLQARRSRVDAYLDIPSAGRLAGRWGGRGLRVLVVLPPANLRVGGQERERGWGARPREPVEAVFEDRVDMPVGACADGDGAGTRGLEAGVTGAFGETQDPEAGAVALLGMGSIREDGFDEGGRLRADRWRPR